MPDIEYVNPQINTCIQKEISIQVSLSGFSFLIKSVQNNLCLAFKNYEFNNLQLIDELVRRVEDIISNDSLLTGSFERVKITYICQKATLVPEEFFNVDNLKKLFEFNHSLNELDELHHSKIGAINAHNVYAIPNYLCNAFYTQFGKGTFEHQSTKLIEYGAQTKEYNNSIVIGINSTFFDLTVFEKGHLLLHNSFQYTNALDFIYFLLYALGQLKIDAKKQTVYLFGKSPLKKTITKELKSNGLKVIKPKINTLVPSKLLSKIDLAEYYNLFL